MPSTLVDNMMFIQINKLMISLLGFPHGSDGKKFACNEADLGLIPELGRPTREGNGSPLQYFLPVKSHGQRKSFLPEGLQSMGLQRVRYD